MCCIAAACSAGSLLGGEVLDFGLLAGVWCCTWCRGLLLGRLLLPHCESERAACRSSLPPFPTTQIHSSRLAQAALPSVCMRCLLLSACARHPTRLRHVLVAALDHAGCCFCVLLLANHQGLHHVPQCTVHMMLCWHCITSTPLLRCQSGHAHYLWL